MKNRIVGLIIIAISLVIGFITWSFNKAMNKIVSATCPHGSTCVMYSSINFQTNISLGLMILILLIGLYLIFFGQEKVEVIKKVREKIKVVEKKDYSNILALLTPDERKLLQLVIDSKGAIFQSELVEKSTFNKVKVTRILDGLEGKQLVERRRRGMTNVVLLKA